MVDLEIDFGMINADNVEQVAAQILFLEMEESIIIIFLLTNDALRLEL